jgi:hypothetical protein
MNTQITIGQKGKLGNEVLTVVSVSTSTFKCDNGKMYLTSNAKWMTDGIETAATKIKKEKKYNAAPENYEQEINEKSDIRKFEAIQEKSRMNQRGSSLR